MAKFRMGLAVCLGFFIFLTSVSASYCDCGAGRGRPAYIPQGVSLFDEDESITEEEESLARQSQTSAAVAQDDGMKVPGTGIQYMTDVMQIDVERVDGYADRDGLWNDSDPVCAVWYKLPTGGWSFFNQTDVVEGCNGQECDSVFNHEARIPIPRDMLVSVDVEVWDDDGGGSYELLGKKSFPSVPISGMPMGWRLLDDDSNWNCFAKIRVRYEDNGVDNPVWISYPAQSPTSEAFFNWSNPSDRAGICRSEVHFSSDAVFDESDEAVFTVYGNTHQLVLSASCGLISGAYYCAVRSIDNSGYASDYVSTGQIFQWIEPTPVPPTATPTYTPNPNTPTPAPGSFMVGDIRVYADYFDDLGGGRIRARGNIRINDYVRVDGTEAALFLDTAPRPWIEGQGMVILDQIDTPVFIGDFELEPLADQPQFGIIQPGEFTSLLIQILGFYFHGNPIDLVVNVVEGWVYCETLIEIDLPEIGLHVTHADFILDWLGNISGTVTGFEFQIAGITIAFDQGYFTNQGIRVDYFTIILAPELGGGMVEAWGLNITRDGLWFVQAHIILPVIRLEGGFEITGFDRNIGPEAWIEHLKLPYTGYKWCVDGRIHIPNLGDSGACGIETTFSIFGDQLQQACLSFEGCGLQIPIGNTGLFLYKLGGCVTFNNLPYPDPVNQCAVGTIYDCNEQAITCCQFDFPDTMTIKLLAGLQGGPDILGYKAVHADPLWIDINTGWGVGGGGLIKVINNYEIGAGRVCVDPSGVRVNGYLNLAIIQGTLYLIVTPEHAEGAIDGYVTIPAGDYWIFELDEPINLGHFLLMLGYYYVPESDFWGSGIWSSCNSPSCAGLKYGVIYSHEIFGQILAIAVDQQRHFYAWIDLNFFASMSKTSGGVIEVEGNAIHADRMESGAGYDIVPVEVPENLVRSLFTLGYEGGSPDLYLMAPDGSFVTPDSTDNQTMFYNSRAGWRFYSIKDPQPGTWYFIVNQTEGVENYKVQLLKGNQPPEISIQSVHVQDNRAVIEWTGNDPDDYARVSIFYDTDNQHADGIPIASSLGAGDVDQHTNWDLSGIPSGQYYLYAKIEDGKNAPVISYHPEPVFIQDLIAPMPPHDVQGNTGDQSIHLWWSDPIDPDIKGYEILMGEIGGAWNQVFHTVDREITLSGLQNQHPYRFAVVATDLSGNRSAQSNELILVPDADGDLQAPEPVQQITISCDQNHEINIAWVPSTSEDVGGYRLFYGTSSGIYLGTEANEGASPIEFSKETTSVRLSGLTKGALYYFSVQALDGLNNKSVFAAESFIRVISKDDTDSDNLPDDWEVFFFSSLDDSPAGDQDHDGLSNALEFQLNTSPIDVDSDKDRIRDDLDPDPVRALDSDNDGIADDWALVYDISGPESDHDMDGLTNLQEYRFKTDPYETDTDRDGYSDRDEVYSGSDPADPDDPDPRCTSTSIQLMMPDHFFEAGDRCFLKASLCSPSPLTNPQVRVFIMLEALDHYFFAPAWSDQVTSLSDSIDPGLRIVDVIPEFTWPDSVGHAQNIRFYGVLTDPEMQRVIGEYDIWEFGW